MSANLSFDIPMDLEPLSLPEIIYRSILIGVSLVINTGVLLVICCSRQLHSPRHIYYAAISIANYLLLFNSTCETVAIVWKVEFARRAFVLNAASGYTILLHCLCLATIDRYLAIAYYEGYKAKITNKIAVGALVISSSLAYLAATSPFWTGLKDTRTGTISMLHMNCVLTWDLILGIVCVAINFKIFLVSRAIIPKYIQKMNNHRMLPVSVRFIAKGRSMKEGSVNENRSSFPEASIDISSVYQPSNESPSAINQTYPAKEIFLFSDAAVLHKVRPNRLETRVALNFSMNVLPFWLCTFPVTMAGISVCWCIYFQSNCYALFPVNRQFKRLFFMHHIYNPLAYVFTSSEFKRASRRLLSRLSSSASAITTN